MAEQQFYTLITNVGQAKLANATALGTKVNFVKLQVGDGKDYNPNEAQESLKHKVWEGNINSITTDSKNPNWIVIQTLIPANVGGFNISELGVLDDEGNMLIVSKYPETYKPKLENGSGKDLIIKLVIQVSNTASVTLKLDPSVTIATKEDVKNVEKQITKEYEICTLKHNLNTYPNLLIIETEYGAGIGKAGETPCGGTVSTTIDYKVKYLDRNNLSILTKSLYKKYGKVTQAKIDKQNYIITFANSNKSLIITLGGI